MKTTRKTFLGGMTAMGAMSWRAFAAPARKQRSYVDTTWWDPYVENITDTDTYLRRKFRQDVTDKATGLGTQALKKRLSEVVAAAKASGESWRITKAKCFAAQAMEMSIDVSPLDWFPAISVWDRNDRPINNVRGGRAREVNARMLPAWVTKEWYAGNKDGSWNMWQDFDHSVPDWRVIMALGYPGMKKRLEKYAVKGDPFYEGLVIAMDAMLGSIDRFIAQGKKNLERIENNTNNLKQHTGLATPTGAAKSADEFARATNQVANSCSSCFQIDRLAKEIACLERLRNGPPQTAYDMMMFVWLYFFWSEHLDGDTTLMAESEKLKNLLTTPSFPSQPEGKIGLPRANPRGRLRSPS